MSDKNQFTSEWIYEGGPKYFDFLCFCNYDFIPYYRHIKPPNAKFHLFINIQNEHLYD